MDGIKKGYIKKITDLGILLDAELAVYLNLPEMEDIRMAANEFAKECKLEKNAEIRLALFLHYLIALAYRAGKESHESS